MKLLYQTASGQVLARYGDATDTPFQPNPEPKDGQSLIDVPDTVAIPDAIIRVIQYSSEEGQTTYEFVIDQEAVSNLWRSVKAHRNQLLKDSDWICSVTDYCPPNKDQWVAYRQGLRDITSQPNPFRLVWPKEPSLSLPASQPASASSESSSEPSAESTSAVPASDSQPASSESSSEPSAESTSAVPASEPQSPPSSSEPAPLASDSQPASESASSDPASAPSDPASESASEPASAPSDPTSAPSADSTSASESAVPASDPVV